MRFYFTVAALLAAISSPARAGVFTDDLGRCMVQKTADRDKTELVRWMFASMTRNPSLASMTAISESQREQINKKIAGLYDRLILVDCRSQAVDAIKNEGVQAFFNSGQVLGGAAAQLLMSSPEAEAELTKWSDFLDKAGWESLAEQAGVKLTGE